MRSTTSCARRDDDDTVITDTTTTTTTTSGPEPHHHAIVVLDLEKAVPRDSMDAIPVPEGALNILVAGDGARELSIGDVTPLVLILTGATFITTASNSAVIIILPVISTNFSIPPTRQEWIVSTFALTSGSFLLLAGKLGDVYGKRGLFIAGSAFIAAMAVGCALAPGEVWFYVFRALMGLGCAITLPTAIGVIGYTIPPGRTKTYSFAFFSGGAPLGQVLGNLLGGIISAYASWEIVFYVLGAASFLVAATAIFIIPKEPRHDAIHTHAHPATVDWNGAFMFTAGLLLLLTGMSEGVSAGWETPYVSALLVIAVVSLAGFVWWQMRLEKKGGEPLMKLSVFGNAEFAWSMVVVFFFSAGFTNFLVYSTYFYQNYQMLSTIQTTLRFIPLGIVGVICTFLSGYFLPLLPGNYIVSIGLTCALLSNLLFAIPILPSTSYFAYGLPAMCLAAFGADTVYPCLGLFTTQALPRRDQGVAGGIFHTMAAMGRALSLPVTAGVQRAVGEMGARRGRDEKEAYLWALRAVEGLCVGFMLVALGATVGGLKGIGRIGGVKKLGGVVGEREVEVEVMSEGHNGSGRQVSADVVRSID